MLAFVPDCCARVPQAMSAGQGGCRGAAGVFIRSVIVKDFPVLKDLLRFSVANPSEPEKFTEKFALYEVYGMRGARVA